MLFRGLTVNATSPLIREQLLPEQAFIGYCNRDEANKYTPWNKQIDPQFIRAAKNEGLLIPLYSAEGSVRQPDGSGKIEMVDFYSPLQLYIVTELRNNVVRDGVLWNSESIEWYPEKPIEERPRYILWGTGMAFLARKIGDKARKKTDDYMLNPYVLTVTFNTFLRFIHTTPLKDRHALPDEKIDIFGNTPVFNHDLSKIVSLSDELKKYHLNTKNLEILRANVGQVAAVIDPLELWYYYLNRHPGSRKGLLKENAQVAQKLYKIYDLITEVWEKATNEKAQPFFEFIGGELGGGYLTPKVEYVHGEDIQAMRQSMNEFKDWTCVRGNNKFVTSQIQQALSGVTADLDEYETRYGDRGHGGSYRVRKDEGIRYDQLDDSSKEFFDQMRAQDRNDEDWSIISWAIEDRLNDIQRSLSEVYRSVGNQLSTITLNAWDAHKNLGSHFWMQHGELSHEARTVLFQKENQKLLNNAKKCKEKERGFWRAVSKVGLTFCTVCRKRPIQLHTDSNRHDFQSQPSICDECVNEKKTSPDNIKDAEWKCMYCGTLVYKFVHGNTWSTRTQTGVSVVSELKYGRVELKVTCPNKECKKDLHRVIEWGWLP